VQRTTPSSWPRPLRDLGIAGAVVALIVLLGAPAGLLWAQLAPRFVLTVDRNGATAPDLETNEAFIGADGSYLLVMLVMGALTGLLAWRFARRAGPFTVLALVVGGTLAALVAATVGLRPGSQHALQALGFVPGGEGIRGQVELFLGRYEDKELGLRAPWAAVAWPVGALVVFLVAAIRRPDSLD
jgi:hypothetical protein